MNSIAPGTRVESDFSSIDRKNDENLNDGQGKAVFFFFFPLLFSDNGSHRAIETRFYFSYFWTFQKWRTVEGFKEPLLIPSIKAPTSQAYVSSGPLAVLHASAFTSPLSRTLIKHSFA